MSKLVRVASYYDLPMAQLARAKLESSGIECVLGNENLVGVNWLLTVAVDGVELCVWEEDAAAAADILSEKSSASYLAEQPVISAGEVDTASLSGVNERVATCPEEPRLSFDQEESCPKCGKAFVEHIHYGREFAAATFLIGVPIPFVLRRKRCKACGHRWK